jgi:hypothetical protein
MRRLETLTALGLIAVSVIVMVEALRLGAGWGDTGPLGGFFPFWLAVTLGLANLWILVKARLRPGSPGVAKPLAAGAVRRVLTTFLPMVGAFLLMELVGFYLASFFYLLVYTRLTGGQSWTASVTVSVLFSAAAFVVFGRWFLMPLPKGLFGDRLLPF